MNHPHDHYRDKVVCITGAGGSIGSEIARTLASAGVKELRLVGHSEEPLYRIEKELAPAGARVYTILGSVADARLMCGVMHGTQVVIHAAAHKHVPLCEKNPLEAILNNVGGTTTLANLASNYAVEQFIMVSTDKAVKPASIMGMTKRVCELYMKFMSARSSTKFTTVRFGNVLDSSGSVLPLWREQITRGGPVTLTDKRCTRYFMSIPDAVNLVLEAGALRRPDGLYVLDMGKPVNMYDMAVWLIAGRRIEIVETGLRPGEKLEEELHYDGELVATAVKRLMRVREHENNRITRWGDFDDLLMAARSGAQTVALEKLREICS